MNPGFKNGVLLPVGQLRNTFDMLRCKVMCQWQWQGGGEGGYERGFLSLTEEGGAEKNLGSISFFISLTG